MTRTLYSSTSHRLLGALALAAFAVGCATTAAISDSDFSFKKGSVFDATTPVPFAFEEDASATLVRPLPGSGMPPMISHTVDEFLPLTIAKNECRDCHDKPANIGKPVTKSKAMPASTSHYIKDATGKLQLSGMAFNCLACHAPQAGVVPLVINTSR